MTRGFTLVETVIVLGITGFLVVALATTFGVFDRLFGYEDAYRGITYDASAIMRAAEDAIAPAARVVGSRAFASGTYSSGESALVVEMPAVDADGVAIADAYDYAAFYAADGTVYGTVETAAASARRAGTRTLGSAVSSLSFAYDTVDPADATSVTVRITASSTAHGTDAVGKLEETIRLRNS
jgi:hypothetical protein